MPKKKRKNIGQISPKAKKVKLKRASETPEQRQYRLEQNRVAARISRAAETAEQRETRLCLSRASAKMHRARVTAMQQKTQPQKNRTVARALSNEIEESEQREVQLQHMEPLVVIKHEDEEET